MSKNSRFQHYQNLWSGIQKMYYSRPDFDEGEGEERELLADYYIESEAYEYEGDGSEIRTTHNGIECDCEDFDYSGYDPYIGCEETCGCIELCADALQIRNNPASH